MNSNHVPVVRQVYPAMHLRRVAARSVAALLLLLLPTTFSHADVIGEGDVSPNMDPDLPILGGRVTGDLIVGDTDIGLLTIDIPAFTDALEAANVTIGNGGEFGLRGQGIVTISGFVGDRSELLIDDLLIVGSGGDGRLAVLSGARVISDIGGNAISGDFDTVVGLLEGSHGIVEVSGFGSVLRSTNLVVGEEGRGEVEVTNAGRLETFDEAFIGNERDSTAAVGGTGRVEIRGRGSRWEIGDPLNVGDGNLFVGNEGRGSLLIEDEGFVRVTDEAFVGVEANSYGEVSVIGLQSLWWVEEEIFIGDPTLPTAQGQLNVESQGTVRADDAVRIAAGGRVDLDGGLILTPLLTNSGVMRGDGRIETTTGFTNLATGDLRNAALTANHRERLLVAGEVANFGIIESVGGEMEFEDLVTNNAGAQIFAVDAIVRFRGGLAQNGSVFFENSIVESTSPIINTANMAVGAGSSFVLGDLVLAANSELDMQLGDFHSELQITGTAALDGTLSLGLDDGFRPIIGDSFRILTADLGVTGTFATEVFPEISGIGFDVVYNADNVIVNVTSGATITGDFNGDGNVDGLDLGFWEQNFGTLTGATRSQGDANADGDVDGRDFLSWQRQKTGAPATPIGAPVPEPSTLGLLLLGLLARPARKR